jgi:hypothetical protein
VGLEWTVRVGHEPSGGLVAKYELFILERRTVRKAGTDCPQCQVGLPSHLGRVP